MMTIDTPQPVGKSGLSEDEERLDDLQHADELNEMKARLWGLRMAILGATTRDDREMGGILQLADDIVDQIDACAEAFEAERQLRMAEE